MFGYRALLPTVLAATLVMAALPASAAKLSLAPGVYNPGNLEGISASWVSLKTKGKGKAIGQQALRLEKLQPTAADAAAGADIMGIAGTPVSMLKGLCWTVVDGHCGAGAPRWNIYLDTNADGAFDSWVFLGCTYAGEDGCFSAEEIAMAVQSAGLPAESTISYLQIIFDEGTDVGPGYVVLKNISVTIGDDTKVFNPANSKQSTAEAQQKKKAGGKKK